jgi:hypothetical protein
MRSVLRRVVLPVGLAGLCVVAAVVLAAGWLGLQTGDRSVATVGRADRSSADITGSLGGSARAGGLHLTDEQRGHIFDGIMKLRDAPVADVAAPDLATALPRSVALQELPASVTREIPLVQGYKFVKLEDRILLVSPLDRSVVAMMPRYRTIMD